MRGQHAMARDYNRYRISTASVADSACTGAELSGEFTILSGATRGQFAQRPPNAALEGGPGKMQRDGKACMRVGEIGLKLGNDASRQGRGRFEFRPSGRQKVYSGQSV